MHPDVIILLEDGRVKSVVSNHHLTYAVIEKVQGGIAFDAETNGSIPAPPIVHEADFVGTHRQMLRRVGFTTIEPTKEFDPTAVVMLADENKFLRNALGKYGFTIDPAIRALAATPDRLNQAFVKALRALYNAFIVTDPKLMGQYLDVQTR